MTDEAKKSYEWLLSLASWKGFVSYLIGTPEAAKQAADMIDELSRNVEEYEAQIAGLEIMLTTAQSAAKAWKRRYKAAERDLETLRLCYCCKHYHKELAERGRECDPACSEKCVGSSAWVWRGPCAENGGADDGGNQVD